MGNFPIIKKMLVVKMCNIMQQNQLPKGCFGRPPSLKFIQKGFFVALLKLNEGFDFPL